MAKKKVRKSPGPMHSKAQWRYLFARFGNKGFTKRWARQVEARGGKKTGYRALPLRKGIRRRA
jgi:hypothetical protein